MYARILYTGCIVSACSLNGRHVSVLESKSVARKPLEIAVLEQSPQALHFDDSGVNGAEHDKA